MFYMKNEYASILKVNDKDLRIYSSLFPTKMFINNN